MKGRIDWRDRLRVLAVLDIIEFHLQHQYLLWGIGLPATLLLSVAVAALGRQPWNTPGFVQARVNRILIPWLFWSMVLGVYVALVAWRRGESLDRVFRWSMLLTGPMVHLWFIPFIFVAGIAAHYVSRLIERVPVRVVAPLALAAAAALLWWAPARGLGFPYAQWGFALVAVPLGLGVAGSSATRSRRASRSKFRPDLNSRVRIAICSLWRRSWVACSFRRGRSR